VVAQHWGRHKACPYGAGTPSGNDNPVGATLVVALHPGRHRGLLGRHRGLPLLSLNILPAATPSATAPRGVDRRDQGQSAAAPSGSLHPRRRPPPPEAAGALGEQGGGPGGAPVLAPGRDILQERPLDGGGRDKAAPCPFCLRAKVLPPPDPSIL
jgi:hypothetical protein